MNLEFGMNDTVFQTFWDCPLKTAIDETLQRNVYASKGLLMPLEVPEVSQH